MHFKRKRPRTSNHSRAKGQCPKGNPSWWNLTFMTKPQRRKEKQQLRNVFKGDWEQIWNVAPHKPHLYFW